MILAVPLLPSLITGRIWSYATPPTCLAFSPALTSLETTPELMHAGPTREDRAFQCFGHDSALLTAVWPHTGHDMQPQLVALAAIAWLI